MDKEINDKSLNKISTKNLTEFPSPVELKKLCKSIAAIEAILMEDWNYRYYSYNKNWDQDEEIFEMRDGSGDQMLIHFQKNGTIINGFAHESKMNGWTSNSDGKMIQNIWKGVLDDLPQIYNEFIFGNPIKNIGTTFCIWSIEGNSKWKIGQIEYPNDQYFDGSEELLNIFDKKPTTYKDWALDYYELEDIEIAILAKIYEMQPITNSMVKILNPSLVNMNQLKKDLDEIGYQYSLE